MSSEPRPVRHVDYEQYAGLWYEIARLPFVWEQPGTTNVTATYSLIRKDPLTLKVDNRSIIFPGNIQQHVEGIATLDPSDPDTNAKLLVDFNNSTTPGKYWILEVDEYDYEWALVGTPDRTKLWILTRELEMTKKLWGYLIKSAEFHGYRNLEQNLIYTHHSSKKLNF